MAIDHAKADVSSAVSIAAGEYAATIEQAGHFLLAISHASEAQGTSVEACDRFLRSMIQGSPLYINLVIVESDGGLFSSVAEHPGPVSYADRSWFSLVRQTRQFVNGGFQMGKLTQKPMFTLAYPTFDAEGRVRRIVVAAVDLGWMSGVAGQMKLSPESVVTVFDRNGTILARSPDAESWIGKSVPEVPIVSEAIRKNAAGTIRGTGVDGVERVYAFQPLSGTAGAGAFVSVGIPTSEVFADSQAMLLTGIAGLLVVLAAAGLFVWFGAEFLILRGVRVLVEATQRLAHGEAGVRTSAPRSGREIGMLAAAFDKMAEALDKRDAERRQAEEQIRALADRLEQRVAERTTELEEANRGLEAFSYSVSHDLRAPLRHVSGFVDLLSKHIHTDEKGERYISVIRDSCRRMAVLIDDLLTFSRIGRQTLGRSPVKLKELVEEAVAEADGDAAGHGVEWKIGELPEVLADRNLLKQALMNLLGNAVKYTRPREKAVIEVDCLRADGETVVRVGDNGVGFDPRFASRLFGVFQRLHDADKFEGTGIGLAIVKNIISRHGGRVWAESVPDKGSSFYFTLPERG